MRFALAASVGLAAALLLQAPVASAQARDVAAAAPHDLSVTVYRSPERGEGGFDLNNLQGFAFITETRRVVLPAGTHRLRFEGVADGIETASALVTGLPSGVIEKNRDAALISPSALVEATQAQGGRVQLLRTDPAKGTTTRVSGTIRSGADGGVVVETSEGIEALRCSGLPETVEFESGASGLSSVPTLSVMTRSETAIEAEVQLSYIARGFDWTADYVATLALGGKQMDLGAWVTLVNGNGVSFRDARVQVVAGKLNKENGEIEPILLGQPILAQCWPRGSTSDEVPPVYIERAFPYGFSQYPYPVPMAAMAAPMARGAMAADEILVTVTASKRMEQEELGDLKLYRVPDRTTLASRQSKQVRLMDRDKVPVETLREADLYDDNEVESQPVPILIRTRNTTRNQLGLPLPSGRVAVFEPARGSRLLTGETGLRDLAVDEEVKIYLDPGADVLIRQTSESRLADGLRPPPRINGVGLGGYGRNAVKRIGVTNARATAVQVEIRLELDDGDRLIAASMAAGTKDGRPIFKVTVPANGSAEVRYQTASPRN